MSRLRNYFWGFLFPVILLADTAQQQINICYYDSQIAEEQIKAPPPFLKPLKREHIEKGYMLIYQKKLFDYTRFFSCYGGIDIGNWNKKGDSVYTGSTFISYRIWILPLPLFHPYVEYSAMGPAIISNKYFGGQEFETNFLFQNYYGAGIEFGEGRGIVFDCKMIRYSEGNFNKDGVGFHIPLLVSLGISY